MNLNELNKLDLKTLADWPLPTKLAALALLCVAIVAAGWWFDWRSGMEALDAAKQKETELRGVFTTKKNQAINLDAYIKQRADIEHALTELRQGRARLEVRRQRADQIPREPEQIARCGTDRLRLHQPAFGEASAHFAMLNRGKRSILLDLHADLSG
mgnify:CR=1 FL=1